MKKSFFSLLLSLGCLYSLQAQVVISEIMYNPPESGTDSLEYLEIVNIGNNTIDISGWSFTQGIAYTFPQGTVIPATGFLVIAKSASAFQSVFGVAPSLVWVTPDALTNGGEDLELRDESGNVIDYVDYKNALPWPPDANGLGGSLVLCDFTADNSLPANWQTATTGTGVIINNNEVKANPFAASGCMGNNQIAAVDDNFSVPATGATSLPVQGNDLIVSPITTFVITVAPTQGSATISGNTISYQPNNGYCGPDQFTYQICDNNGCDEAVVTLNVKCYSVETIGAVTGEEQDGTASSLNMDVELTGVVYGVNIRPINGGQPSLLFTIIDGSGDGIAVSSLGGTYGYDVVEKDRITVRGTITQFNGQTEIRPDTIIKISANNSLLAPSVVTNLSEATESKLVKINGLHFVDPTEWTTGMGSSGFNVRVVANSNPLDTILLRIDRDVETYNAALPGEPFDLTGIGGQFDASNPYTSGYQILPRYNPDISTIMIGTQEVDFSHLVSVSPNPAVDFVQIDLKQSFDRLSVLSIKGQVIKTYYKPESQQTINVSLFKAGVYLIRLEKNGQAWTTRFVKQ